MDVKFNVIVFLISYEPKMSNIFQEEILSQHHPY